MADIEKKVQAGSLDAYDDELTEVHLSQTTPPPKKRLSPSELKRQGILLVLAVIFVLYGLLFYYAPILGWVMAFEDFKFKKGFFKSDWIWFKNFKVLFDPRNEFVPVIRNTFCMGALNLVTSTVAAIAFAILLNEVKNKLGKKLVQTISYMPHFLSWIVVCAIIQEIFSYNGIINEILMLLHIVKEPIIWFQIPQFFWPIVAISNLWKETGWNAIIYLAAITAIDPCLYEAAEIDGAGRFGKMRYITFPGILPTIMILLVMNIGNVLNAGFEIQYILGRTGPCQSVAWTIDIFVLIYGSSNYGLGTAAGIFKSMVAIILIVIANFTAKKLGQESLF